MRRALWSLLGLSSWLSACAPPEGAPCEGPCGGNVLLVVLDDMGLETVGAYGLHPDPPSTPNLDALAEAGMRFDRVYATPVCAASRATLLTGRHGRRHGLGNNIPFDTFDHELPLKERTIARAASEGPYGYTTAAFGKWHLMTRSTRRALDHPNASGFDHFDGTLANPTDVWDRSDGRRHDHFHWERLVDGQTEHVSGYLASSTVDAALDWIPGMAEPWLVYMALHLPHGPLHVPPSHLQGTDATEASPPGEQFAAMVEAADTELGRLLDGLPAETTVIVVGDNGTEEPNVRSPWAVRGPKGTMFEGGLRVPLLVAGPPVASPGAVSDALAHTVDVAATVAHLTGGQLSEPVDGVSLLPLLADPEASSRELVYTEMFGPAGHPPYTTDLRTVLDENYKLIRDAVTGQETMHALALSPADESSDLLETGNFPEAEYRKLAAALDHVDSWLKEQGPLGCSQGAIAYPPGALLTCLSAVIAWRRRALQPGRTR